MPGRSRPTWPAWRRRGGLSLALAAAWRTASTWRDRIDATMVHGHWVVPGGVSLRRRPPARPRFQPAWIGRLLAERHSVVGRVARWASGAQASPRVQRRPAPAGLRARRLRRSSATVPYGVDARRSKPDPEARPRPRQRWGLDDDAQVVLRRRPLRREGFESSSTRSRPGARAPRLRLVLAGGGDLGGSSRRASPVTASARVTICQAFCIRTESPPVSSRRCRGRAVGARPCRQRGRPAQRRDGGASIGTALVATPAAVSIGGAAWLNGATRAGADPRRLSLPLDVSLDNRSEAAALSAAARRWVERWVAGVMRSTEFGPP